MGANASTAVPLYASGQVLDAARLNLTNAGIPVFSGTATRDAAFGGSGEKVLAEGQLCYLEDTNAVQYYDSAAWQAVSATSQVAIFNETQASGTNGGTATSGSFVKRTLNTTIVNEITGCSIASSVITLPAGTYVVQGFGTAFGTSIGVMKTRLQNTTDATTTQQGTNAFTTSDVTIVSEFNARFVITASKNFELQTRVGGTQATNGYGPSVGYGDEVYSQIIITKVA